MARSKDPIKYWQDREKQKLLGQLNKQQKLEKLLKKEYDTAIKEINSDIAKLFIRYMEQNNLSYSEASKLLSSSEYKDWKYDLKGYIKKIEETGDPKILLELNTLAMKSRISRLEELFYQVDKQINNLYGEYHKGMTNFLDESVKESYYQTIYSVQKYFGQGNAFGMMDKEIVEDILKYPWCGKNYSSTIWDNRDKLKKVVRSEVTQMIIQGKGNKEVAERISSKLNGDFKHSLRIVNTEHSYIMGEATARAFEETGVEKYQFLATLDDKTCDGADGCQGLDLEIFDLKDRQVGVNASPIHPNCRCTEIPYLEDRNREDKTRSARVEDGKSYKVPATMSYKQWYKEHVIGMEEE